MPDTPDPVDIDMDPEDELGVPSDGQTDDTDEALDAPQ
jgi:hypothetical protein